MTELLVVLAIILIVGGLSLPTFSRSIDSARLKSAAQQVASIYQQGRNVATRDDSFHEILVSAPLNGPAQVCVDMDGDAVCEVNEPQVLLPPQVRPISTGVPVELDSATLGFSPLASSSTTYNQQNIGVHALAWNGRGLPCQRTSTTSGCANWTTTPAGAGSVAWVQYLQMPQSGGVMAYAAVTVSPTGRIKMWTYAPGQNGSGSWY